MVAPRLQLPATQARPFVAHPITIQMEMRQTALSSHRGADSGSKEDVNEFCGLHKCAKRRLHFQLLQGLLHQGAWSCELVSLVCKPIQRHVLGCHFGNRALPFCSPSIRCRVARPRPSHSLEPAYAAGVIDDRGHACCETTHLCKVCFGWRG